MSSNLKCCPICKCDELKSDLDGNADIYKINCRRCGWFKITETALLMNTEKVDENSYLLSGYLRNNSTRKQQILIKSDILGDLKNFVSSFKGRSVINKLNDIIDYVGERTTIGEKTEIDLDKDFTQFYCKNELELLALLDYAVEQSLLKYHRRINNALDAISLNNDLIDIELTFQGWKRFDENKSINIGSKTVFVAMNFDKDCENIFEKISDACVSCDFKASRVDKSEHNEKICDKIISDIRQSRFLIAEFTGQKHGVYFEAGYAYALGLPVIWCCHKDDVDKLHFDTRQYNHIIWSDVEELKTKLINRIKATII